MAISQRQDPWQQALRWLTAGDRSAHELRTRLAARGHATAVIDATMKRLRGAGYIDDARVATVAVGAAARRGQGSERVRAQLLARGIAAASVEAAIEASFSDELSLARNALRKRQHAMPSTPSERAKAARFLAQRGFPEAIVLTLLGAEES